MQTAIARMVAASLQAVCRVGHEAFPRVVSPRSRAFTTLAG
jgi:hypothetical protein